MDSLEAQAVEENRAMHKIIEGMSTMDEAALRQALAQWAEASIAAAVAWQPGDPIPGDPAA